MKVISPADIKRALIEEIRRQPTVCTFGEFYPSDANGEDDYSADPLIGVDGKVDLNALTMAVWKAIR